MRLTGHLASLNLIESDQRYLSRVVNGAPSHNGLKLVLCGELGH